MLFGGAVLPCSGAHKGSSSQLSMITAGTLSVVVVGFVVVFSGWLKVVVVVTSSMLGGLVAGKTETLYYF